MRLLPGSIRRRLCELQRWGRNRPPVGLVRIGSLRRLSPISANWGYDRGLPVDRHYIEAFMWEHHRDVRGRVLEIRDPGYTHRFGSEVEQSDVLDIDPTNPLAVADHWRFTVASATRLFSDVFGSERVKVRSYGNVLAATAFLRGLSSRELRGAELHADDPRYELLIAVRAVRTG